MKKTALKAILLAFLFIISSLAVLGCNRRSGEGADESLIKVLEAKKLVVGIDAEYPPMTFYKDGQLIGFDIDMAKDLCSRLEISIEFKAIDWSKKDEELNGGAIDCIWSGFAITAKRAESLNLSEPYIKNDVMVVIPKGCDISVIDDLEGKKVGLQSGSSTHDALMASGVYDKVEVVQFNSATEMLNSLEEGLIDAAVADSLNIRYFAKLTAKAFYSLSDSLQEEQCAVAFRKGDKALRDKVQEIIGQMKADGTLGSISAKWFGSDITIVK